MIEGVNCVDLRETTSTDETEITMDQLTVLEGNFL
jgi:hypothetical protein